MPVSTDTRREILALTAVMESPTIGRRELSPRDGAEMRKNWVACTSKDHEGRTVYINLDRVDMVYEHEGETIVVMADWDGKPLSVVESPEAILRSGDD